MGGLGVFLVIILSPKKQKLGYADGVLGTGVDQFSPSAFKHNEYIETGQADLMVSI